MLVSAVFLGERFIRCSFSVGRFIFTSHPVSVSQKAMGKQVGVAYLGKKNEELGSTAADFVSTAWKLLTTGQPKVHAVW